MGRRNEGWREGEKKERRKKKKVTVKGLATRIKYPRQGSLSNGMGNPSLDCSPVCSSVLLFPAKIIIKKKDDSVEPKEASIHSHTTKNAIFYSNGPLVLFSPSYNYTFLFTATIDSSQSITIAIPTNTPSYREAYAKGTSYPIDFNATDTSMEETCPHRPYPKDINP